MSIPEQSADVVVVGGGPAGSTAAYYLAQAGLDVVVLEKTTFPREKVCGDGLTPRGVKQLVAMGIDISPDAGWIANRGLRVIGGGMRLHMPWPELASFPSFGLVRKRLDLDDTLARHAVKAGARLLEGTPVTAPLLDDATGRVTGVVATESPTGRQLAVRAPVVVAADGNSSRLSLAVGRRRLENRPMGVAVRTYFESPRHDDDWLESWLELWDRSTGRDVLLPGYGWVFGVGDGTSNVGLGVLNTSAGYGRTDYKELLHRWVRSMPADWGFSPETQVGPVRGAALPMAFNRKPHYADGLLLVGDAGGMVNPFNGEGIPYAMESGALAAEAIVQALARPAGTSREAALRGYSRAVAAQWGGYYSLGRMFVRLIGHPSVMKLATNHGLPRPVLMRVVHKLLANLTDPRGGDAIDHVITALSGLAPAA